MGIILSKIKEETKRAGQSKGKFIFFREGEKKRIRFLIDFEDGMKIPFHDSFEKSINVPCQELYGKECEYCEDESLRTRNLYVWSVYDYEAKEVKLLMQAVNNCTAIPAIVALYETYGTLLDRDLVVTRTGKQQSTTYAVVPMDKNRFRNEKAKALSEKAVLKCLAQAYPDVNAVDDDEDDDDEKPAKKKASKGFMNKPTKAEEDDEDWGEEEKVEVDYSEMSAKELYQLCKERKLEVLPKKLEKYYIKQLEEFDKAQEDWDEEEDDEDWDE